jgi:hypothetical protein
MRPQSFPPISSVTGRPVNLQEVFDQVWELLTLRFPRRTRADEKRLRAFLAKAISQHSAAGVRDANELFRLSLKTVLAQVNIASGKAT